MFGPSATWSAYLSDKRLNSGTKEWQTWVDAQALTLTEDLKHIGTLCITKNLKGNSHTLKTIGDSGTAGYFETRGNQAELIDVDNGWTKELASRPFGGRAEIYDEDKDKIEDMGGDSIQYALDRRTLVDTSCKKAEEQYFVVTLLAGMQGATIPTSIPSGIIDPYSADGLTLFNSSHKQTPNTPLTFSNQTTQSYELSPDSLKIVYDASLIRSSRDNPMFYQPERVILSHNLIPDWGVYSTTDKKVGTNFNDSNIMRFTGTKDKAPAIISRLPAGYWFVLRSASDGSANENGLMNRVTWKRADRFYSYFNHQTHSWTIEKIQFLRYQAPADPSRWFSPLGPIS